MTFSTSDIFPGTLKEEVEGGWWQQDRCEPCPPPAYNGPVSPVCCWRNLTWCCYPARAGKFKASPPSPAVPCLPLPGLARHQTQSSPPSQSSVALSTRAVTLVSHWCPTWSHSDMKLARMGAEDDNQNSILKGILQNGSSFNYPGL